MSHDEVMLRRAILWALWCAGTQPIAGRASLAQFEIFDTDANHVWNKTYDCLLTPERIYGRKYCEDALNTLLWPRTRRQAIFGYFSSVPVTDVPPEPAPRKIATILIVPTTWALNSSRSVAGIQYS